MKRLARRGLVLTALAAALCLFCEGWGETGGEPEASPGAGASAPAASGGLAAEPAAGGGATSLPWMACRRMDFVMSSGKRRWKSSSRVHAAS